MSSTLKEWKQSLEKMAERSKAVSLNKQIAQHASRKQLAEAMELFEEAVSKGWANSHTFSAAINANIRCGSIEGAAKLFERLRKTKGLKLDVITCTTMMKGFCTEGSIASALGLFQEMKARNVAPNIRTFNTFFRGCVMTGDIDQAEAMIIKMQKEYKIQPDIPAWEYLVTLLCQGLRLDKVQPIVGRLRSDKSLLSELGAIFVNMARAAAILGDWKACRKAIAGAKEAIELNEKQERVQSTEAVSDDVDEQQEFEGGPSSANNYHDDEDQAANKGQQRQVTGGRRAWKSSNEEEYNPRAESLEMFKEHRRAELRREIDKIEEFMSKRTAASSSRDAQKEAGAGGAASGGVAYVLPYFKRVFSFPMCSPPANGGLGEEQEEGVEAAAAAGAATKARIVDRLTHAVEDNFGLSICAEKVVVGQTAAAATAAPVDSAAAKPSAESTASAAASSGSSSGGTAVTDTKKKKKNNKDKNNKNKSADNNSAAKKGGAKPDSPAVQYLSSFRESYADLVDDKGYVDFDKVFADNEEARSGPVKLEICSGAGEWAVAQAVADPASRWATLELRHDRVYQTFARAVFSGASNLCVMGGDATKVLPENIAPASVQYIFVNHPEPPQQIGGHESQGKHLLTGQFFNEMARILKPDGLLTIVTDNHWYAKFLIRELSIQPHPRPLSSVSAEQLLTPLAASASAPASAPAAAAAAVGDDNKGKHGKDKGKKRGRENEEEMSINDGIWNLLETEGGFKLYEGRPGIECGVAVDASSYFDRLWKRGQLVERYFLVLRKAGSTLNIPGPSRKSGTMQVAAGVTNKKIKFDD